MLRSSSNYNHGRGSVLNQIWSVLSKIIYVCTIKIFLQTAKVYLLKLASTEVIIAMRRQNS